VVDGTDTPAVFRPSNTTFYFRHTNTQGNADQTLTVGSATFLPVAGRWSQSDNTVTPPPPPAPTISGPLPNALVDYPYSANLTKSGGQAPVTVQKTSGDQWISVSAAGVVSGTPPTSGTFNVGVQITDALGRSATATVPIAVRTGCEGAGAALQTQCLALVDLYRSTNGSGWLDSTGWLAGNPCTWHGVAPCVGNTVTNIVLDNNNLTGTLPDLSDLSGLQTLDLSENSLNGQLPDLGALTELTELNLGDNLLDGTVPAGVWALPNLAGLNLSGNTFNDTIDAINLPALVTLNLSDSGLGGPIPVGLWSSALLAELDLSNNGFTGAIPAAIGGLPVLVELDLSDNALGGPGNEMIPAEFIQLQDNPLAVLGLSGNQCFIIDPLDTALVTFVSDLDPEWADGCTV
jgi:hypothetical protein